MQSANVIVLLHLQNLLTNCIRKKWSLIMVSAGKSRKKILNWLLPISIIYLELFVILFFFVKFWTCISNLIFLLMLCRSWGILSLTIAYFWQLYTLWILVQLHEAVPGKRYNRYVELAQAAFGELEIYVHSLFEKTSWAYKHF